MLDVYEPIQTIEKEDIYVKFVLSVEKNILIKQNYIISSPLTLYTMFFQHEAMVCVLSRN